MDAKERRARENADFDAKLASIIAEAKAAGLHAVDEFMRTSWMVKDSEVGDASGWAWVKVWKPSYKFRESLKRLLPNEHGFRGEWMVLGFGRDLPKGAYQAITAHEIACKAAVRVMRAHFPDEEFSVDSHMD